MKVQFTDADRDSISAAVAAAEATSNGEILAVTADSSDSYHDSALHWAIAVLIAVLACAAAFPRFVAWWMDLVLGGWRPEPTLGEALTFVMVLAVLKFTIVLLALRYRPLRLALTPVATKQRRVRRRAIDLFKAAAKERTAGRTGILIYLSLAERRAEIIGDEAIVAVTTPETWGEAMAALIVEVRRGRAADGLVAAIGLIGTVLAEHFPHRDDDRNEIPDKLIEL